MEQIPLTIENMSYNDFLGEVNINLLSENDVETYEVGDNKAVIMVIYVLMAKREQITVSYQGMEPFTAMPVVIGL